MDVSFRARRLARLRLLPRVFGQDISGVFLQRYAGNVTITPRMGLLDKFHALSHPTEADMRRYIAEGQRSVWPHVPHIHSLLALESALADAVHRLHAFVSSPQRTAAAAATAAASSSSSASSSSHPHRLSPPQARPARNLRVRTSSFASAVSALEARFRHPSRPSAAAALPRPARPVADAPQPPADATEDYRRGWVDALHALDALAPDPPVDEEADAQGPEEDQERGQDNEQEQEQDEVGLPWTDVGEQRHRGTAGMPARGGSSNSSSSSSRPALSSPEPLTPRLVGEGFGEEAATALPLRTLAGREATPSSRSKLFSRSIPPWTTL
jgi:hypothetical protein